MSPRARRPCFGKTRISDSDRRLNPAFICRSLRHRYTRRRARHADAGCGRQRHHDALPGSAHVHAAASCALRGPTRGAARVAVAARDG